MDIARRWESHKAWNHDTEDIDKDDDFYLAFTREEFEGEFLVYSR